jgi:anti-sigma B factor antagonist
VTLTISDRQSDGFHVIELDGDIDLNSARELRAHFVERITDPATRVVVDLTGVDFIDSSGLGALVGGWQIVRGHGSFRIAGANRTVRRVLEITGMDDVFPLFPAVADATAD